MPLLPEEVEPVPPDEVLPPADEPPDEVAGVVACVVGVAVAGAGVADEPEDVAGVDEELDPVEPEEVAGVVAVVDVAVVDVSADVSAAVVSPLRPATSAAETVITGVAVGTASETLVPPQADTPAPRLSAARAVTT